MGSIPTRPTKCVCGRTPSDDAAACAVARRVVNDMLEAARARPRRVDPHEAAAAAAASALLVDTRPAWQRAEVGEPLGALVIERSHLEWRLDRPANRASPETVDHDVQVIVICSVGYSSSLAAGWAGSYPGSARALAGRARPFGKCAVCHVKRSGHRAGAIAY